ncbi:MAG: hypothetical protein HEQ25_10000 [Dolichospermum sp. DET73]|nr:hypothetical protein [Dolichospermum sp. DET73]
MKGFIKLCGKKGKRTILRLLGCKHFRSLGVQEFRSQESGVRSQESGVRSQEEEERRKKNSFHQLPITNYQLPVTHE